MAATAENVATAQAAHMRESGVDITPLVGAGALQAESEARAQTIHQTRDAMIGKKDSLAVLAGEKAPSRDQIVGYGDAFKSEATPTGNPKESTQDKDNKKQLEIHAQVATTIAEGGDIDALFANADTERAIKDLLEPLVNQDADRAAMYDELRNDEQKAYLKALMQKPGVREKVSRALAQRAGVDKLEGLQADSCVQMHAEIQAMQKEKTALGDEGSGTIGGLTTEVKDLEKELAHFAAKDAYGAGLAVDVGIYAEKRVILEGQLAGKAEMVEQRRQRMDDISEQIKEREKQKGTFLAASGKEQENRAGNGTFTPVSLASGTPGEATLQQFDEDIRKLQEEHERAAEDFNREQGQLKAAKAEIKAIDDRKVKVEADLAEKKAKLEAAQQRKSEIETQLPQKRDAYEQAKQRKYAKEAELVNGFKNAIPEAVAEQMSEDLEEVRQLVLKDMTDGAMKKVRDTYFTSANVPDWDRFQADYMDVYLGGPDGPDRLLKQIIANPQEYDRLKANEGEYTIVMNDLKTNMERLRLTQPAIRWGGREFGVRAYSKKELNGMVQTFGKEHIDQMLGKNTELRQAMDTALRQHGNTLERALSGNINAMGGVTRRILTYGILAVLLGPTALAAVGALWPAGQGLATSVSTIGAGAATGIGKESGALGAWLAGLSKYSK